MPMTCTVCAHPERKAIDKALVAGAAKRRIAADYGLPAGAGGAENPEVAG
jgi:hypothetical protein